MENQAIPSMNEDAKHPDWSADDDLWLAKGKVPAELHGIARRHGRWLFSLVMQGGTAEFAIQGLISTRHPQVMQASAILGKILNDLLTGCLRAKGVPVESYQECKADIARMGALMMQQATDERRSPSGIILNS